MLQFNQHRLTYNKHSVLMFILEGSSMNACQTRIEELVAEQPAAKETTSTERNHAADEIRDSANPFARHTARLRAAMVSIVTEDDVQAVMREMLTMAAAGSIPAMRLVMQYVIGKPIPQQKGFHLAFAQA